MNPVAIVLWICLGIVGYLVGGTAWCMGGVAFGMAFSIFCTVLVSVARR